MLKFVQIFATLAIGTLFFATMAEENVWFAPALTDDDVLEPSIQNEVDHALAIASTNFTRIADMSEDFRLFVATNDIFGTNGLDKTSIATKLVSQEKRDGKWYFQGTNDVTEVAIGILESL